MRGITTIIGCRCLESWYDETMIYFFRSKAYDLDRIKNKWQNFKKILTYDLKYDRIEVEAIVWV